MVSPFDMVNPKKEKSEILGEERFKVCSSCEDLMQPVGLCKHCGCFMKMKTKLVEATCPLNKWEK